MYAGVIEPPAESLESALRRLIQSPPPSFDGQRCHSTVETEEEVDPAKQAALIRYASYTLIPRFSSRRNLLWCSCSLVFLQYYSPPPVTSRQNIPPLHTAQEGRRLLGPARARCTQPRVVEQCSSSGLPQAEADITIALMQALHIRDAADCEI